MIMKLMLLNVNAESIAVLIMWKRRCMQVIVQMHQLVCLEVPAHQAGHG